MKKNALPVLIIVGLILIIVGYLGISAIIRKNTPSNERKDLFEYYNMTDDSKAMLILDNEILKEYGTVIDGHIYVDYTFVYDYLNPRFYWDSTENILLYVTADDIISAENGATSYTVGKTGTDFGKIVVQATPESALISLDFVKQYTDLSFEFHAAPNRVMITKTWGERTVIYTKKDTQLRTEESIKSPILCDIVKDTKLNLIDYNSKWCKVLTEDGILGYIETSKMTYSSTETLTGNFEKEIFEHIQLDKPINLAWHQPWSAADNAKIASILSQADGINVISPFWFKIKDNNGNISSMASKDYVTYCHNQGVDVWAAITNFEVDDVDQAEVLRRTSSRQNLINQIIAKALEYNLDGINVDFEFSSSRYSGEIGDSYIQFLRELSIKCKNNDLVLSTDVPEAISGNGCYKYTEQVDFVDYIILMAYDEHTGQRTGAGSIASLAWATNAVEKLLNEKQIPANQLVLGIPLYTRLWKLTPKTEEGSAEVNYLVSSEFKGLTAGKNWMNKNITSPKWLEDCGQYYGELKTNGVIYKMWLEDSTSVEKRLQMMQAHNLAGAAFFKESYSNSDIWKTIAKYLN